MVWRCKIGSILPIALLAACQPQLQSDLPSGQAAYDVIQPSADAMNMADYHLQSGDVITVNVFQEPDLTQERIVIDRAGNLFLPLIGQVDAAGRTQAELSKDIELAYGSNYLRNPSVAVMVNETLSSTVSVEGEVTMPGVYPIQSGATLLSAMSLARSPTRTAKLDEVLIFRVVNGQRMGARFDLTEVRAGRAADPQILAGDVVVVGHSALQGAYRDILQAAPLYNAFSQF